MSHQKIFTLDNLSLQDFGSESELIPLLTPEDEEEMNNEELPNNLAILPLRNMVYFLVVIPITAGRDKSIRLIKSQRRRENHWSSSSKMKKTNPTKNDIHKIGTVAKILRVLKMPDGNVTVILQGKSVSKLIQ